MKKISETAFLVAMYRAFESERPDALFQDPLARLLAGGQGALQAAMQGHKQLGTTAIALRTRIIDELVERLVRFAGIDTVLNLAAGLDTRPYRLPLPAELLWIEVDLPEVLSYKTQKLQGQLAHCRLKQLELDLTLPGRNTLLSEINADSERTLIITEGLLGYLSPNEVASLATDLYHQSSLRWWVLDLLPPVQQSSKPYAQKIFEQYFSSGGTAFQFMPKEGAAFFGRYGWQVVEVRSVWRESRRLKRSVWAAGLWEWLLRLFARQLWLRINASGIVLLERKNSP
jgi:methyltransferase (TIGR00027 family)